MRALLAVALLLCTDAAFAQDHSQHRQHAAIPQSPPTTATDEHAQHREHKVDASAPGQYRPPALTDADRTAAFPDLHGHDMRGHMDDDPFVWMLMADRLEWQQGDVLAWEGSAWFGTDTDRLWLRSEGERSHGKTTSSLDVLWGTPANAWWDVLAGLRHDQGHGPSRDWIAVGVQGLAPYWFEVQATAYLGSGGRSMLEAEVEYELLLTNRLILQPRAEMRLYGRDDVARGVGAGLSESAAGLRLRYEIRREFAPYVGYEWSSKHGRTADLMRAAGEPTHDQGWVAGLRFWF